MSSEIQLRNLGDTSLDKGVINGKQIIAWDAIGNCKGNDCLVYDRCSFLKKGKCGVQMNYVQTITRTVMDRYRYLDEMALMKIGLHIVPLYSQLCKMKILEMALEDIDIVDDRGRVVIHPVYKSIRETLAVITMMWRDLDISIRCSSDMISTADDIPLAASKNGDSTYYTSLSDSVEKREVTR